MGYQMIKSPTVLVLGAGASLPYGFPLGSELRSEILGLPQSRSAVALNTSIKQHPLFTEFVDAFMASRRYSIDAFLATRMRFAEVGKQVIAAALLYRETNSVDRLRNSLQQDWYDYLWNRLSTVPWDELNFDNLSVVTFNYDRSLEFFLLSAARGTYGVTEEEAVAKLRQLKIVHVYGDLGSPWPGDPRYVSFGEGLSDNVVLRIAEWLKVIPEARDDDAVFIEAQGILTRAEAICFLGFGFDELNLRRLNSSVTCANHVSQIGAEPKRRIFFASCVGKTGAEASRDALLCGQFKTSGTTTGFPPHFIHGDCMATLRASLVLG